MMPDIGMVLTAAAAGAGAGSLCHLFCRRIDLWLQETAAKSMADLARAKAINAAVSDLQQSAEARELTIEERRQLILLRSELRLMP